MVNIVEELAFYGAYHNNLENQLVHIVCVPMILWSALAAVGALTKSRFLPFLVISAYCLYYIKLDRTVGAISTLLYMALWKHADSFVRANKASTVWKWVALTQVFSWGAQIAIGHALFEKRKPALVDSLSQALTLAPLFVVYETLWLAVPGFQAELREKVAVRVEELIAAFPN